MNIKPTPETIWKRPAYLPYVHPPLSDELILQTEKLLGCTLPNDFLDVLRVQNGGPIRFRIPDFVGNKIAGIGPTFPSITDSYLADNQEFVDFSLNGLVPFDGDGHWYYCLDYRESTSQPSVSYIDVECNDQEQVARSFSEFLILMELDLQNELVMQNVVDIDDAKWRLATLFGREFESKISNIGVPYLKCQTGEEWDECFWISPNEVAHGYSGKDPDQFEFEGRALLFPELPVNTVIFEAPEKYIEFYCGQFRDAGHNLVTVHEARMAK